MEKISIVKRRKKKASSVIDVAEGSLNALKNNVGAADSFKNLIHEEDQTFSLNLTPEQAGYVQSNDYIRSMLDEASGDAVLDIQQGKDGRIIFNFNFKKAHPVKMLKSDQVCQMLQISRSSLTKLVRGKKIKSYKIGRLRRFSLEDVLEYLTQNAEL